VGTLLDGQCHSYLDCSQVDFIDAKDVEVLNSFAQSQVTRMSAPSFAKELL
jgi:hypothetical protein